MVFALQSANVTKLLLCGAVSRSVRDSWLKRLKSSTERERGGEITSKHNKKSPFGAKGSNS